MNGRLLIFSRLTYRRAYFQLTTETLACLTQEPHHEGSLNEHNAIRHYNGHRRELGQDQCAWSPTKMGAPKHVHRLMSSGHSAQFQNGMDESSDCDSCYNLHECRCPGLPFPKLYTA